MVITYVLAKLATAAVKDGVQLRVPAVTEKRAVPGN
jgi:hypothetical protein